MSDHQQEGPSPVGEPKAVRLYRAVLHDVVYEDELGEYIAEIHSEWRPPFAADRVDWERGYTVSLSPDAAGTASLLVGQDVRLALAGYGAPDGGLFYQVAAVEAARPLPAVTPDVLGWTLSTIADCGRIGAESGWLGAATTREVTATIANWSDPDGLSQIRARVRAAIDVSREVGYTITAYSHELDPTIAKAATQRLIALTDTGQQACVEWEDARRARNVALLGKRPEGLAKARAWDIAASRVDSYRLRYGIEDPRGLGEPSGERWQDHDRAYVERTIVSAGRFIEPPSPGPDLGISR
jgi:hypothetical protein